MWHSHTVNALTHHHRHQVREFEASQTDAADSRLRRNELGDALKEQVSARMGGGGGGGGAPRGCGSCSCCQPATTAP